MAPLGVPQRARPHPLPGQGQRAAARGLEYELAAEGEDLGRLIAVTDDARSALVHRALNDSAPNITTRVRHAIAVFRGRETTVESKRSAIVTLAGILEDTAPCSKTSSARTRGHCSRSPTATTCATARQTSAATTASACVAPPYDGGATGS